MRTKSLLALGRTLPSDIRSSNLWGLIMACYKNAMPGLSDETEFACECCGDLITLERAKLRSAYPVGGGRPQCGLG